MYRSRCKASSATVAHFPLEASLGYFGNPTCPASLPSGMCSLPNASLSSLILRSALYTWITYSLRVTSNTLPGSNESFLAEAVMSFRDRSSRKRAISTPRMPATILPCEMAAAIAWAKCKPLVHCSPGTQTPVERRLAAGHNHPVHRSRRACHPQ
jgi:hypothetical protein